MTLPKIRDLVAKRVLDAPVELVWKLWTDPKLVMRWWGPAHYSCPSCEMDFREGGTTIVCMRSPEGHDQHSAWHYSRIVVNERIEFMQNLANADGSRMDPTAANLPPDFPENTRTVVTFKARGEQTEMTITEYAMPTGFMGEMAEMGLNQMADKIVAAVADAE